MELWERILTIPQLDTLPEPAPLVDDTFDLASVILLAGPWGSAKSFVAQSISLSVATGSPWYGRPTKRQKVLYIAGEGVYGMSKRIRAWSTAEGVTVGDGDFLILPVAVQMNDPKQVADLCAIIRRNDYGLIVIDTLSKASVGVDENSAAEMSKIVDAAYKIREATGEGSVLLIHHTGKDGKTVRGSVALEAGVDCVYMTEAISGGYKVRRTKAKDRPVEDVRHFDLVAVPGTGSAALSVRFGADIPDGATKLMSAMSAEYPVTGATKAQLRAAAALPNATFDRSLKTLVERGLFFVVGTGTSATYRLSETGVRE